MCLWPPTMEEKMGSRNREIMGYAKQIHPLFHFLRRAKSEISPPRENQRGGIKGQEWLMAKVSSVRGKKQNISRFIAACHRGDEG